MNRGRPPSRTLSRRNERTVLPKWITAPCCWCIPTSLATDISTATRARQCVTNYSMRGCDEEHARAHARHADGAGRRPAKARVIATRQAADTEEDAQGR